MEMLVVLLMAGLISTLLIQGLNHVLNLRIRFLFQLERQTSEMLQSRWFREISGAMRPDHQDGENIFSGDRKRFQGLTFSPLKGMPGVPTRVVMELSHKDGEIFLHYEERNEEIWEIARWKGSGGGFSYLDTKGRWHEQWPPGLEKTNQLPEGILLEADDPRGSIIWFAAVSGLRNPKPRLRDLLGNF